MKIKYLLISILLISINTVGCKNQYQAMGEDKEQGVIIPDSKVLSLADYLRRIPQLYVRGGGDTVSVQLRETGNITGGGLPLYVIDGKKAGHDYNVISRLIDPNDISSIKALTNASETSFYGIDGSSGVILIKTK